MERKQGHDRTRLRDTTDEQTNSQLDIIEGTAQTGAGYWPQGFSGFGTPQPCRRATGHDLIQGDQLPFQAWRATAEMGS